MKNKLPILCLAFALLVAGLCGFRPAGSSLSPQESACPQNSFLRLFSDAAQYGYNAVVATDHWISQVSQDDFGAQPQTLSSQVGFTLPLGDFDQRFSICIACSWGDLPLFSVFVVYHQPELS